MSISTLSVFTAIRQISNAGLNPRPFIDVNTLEQVLGAGIDSFGQYLSHLKNMRLIIFNKKTMTAVKLTTLGQHWEQMPR